MPHRSLEDKKKFMREYVAGRRAILKAQKRCLGAYHCENPLGWRWNRPKGKWIQTTMCEHHMTMRRETQRKLEAKRNPWPRPPGRPRKEGGIFARSLKSPLSTP